MTKYGSGGYKGIGFNPDGLSSANKISSTTGETWRFAVKPEQGQGWSKYSGTAWVVPDPLMDSLRFVNANNEPVNLVLDEKTGRWFQLDVRQAPTGSAIVESFTDKRTTTPDNGTEIESEGKFAEHTGTHETEKIEHIESYFGFRPYNESNKGITGYTSLGYRNNMSVNMQGYSDGATSATKETELVPIVGDLTFDQKFESKRLQIGFTTKASEWRFIRANTSYIQKAVGGDDTERTMSEMTYQQNMAVPVLLMGRYFKPQLNLATGANFGGNYQSLVADQNGDLYAVKFNGAGYGFTDSIANISGDFTSIFILGTATLPANLYSKGSLNIYVAAGGVLHYVDSLNAKTQALAWNGTAFGTIRVTRSGANLIIGESGVDFATQVLAGVVNYTGADNIGLNSVIAMPYCGIFKSALSANTFKYFYNDVNTNNGDNVLPRW